MILDRKGRYSSWAESSRKEQVGAEEIGKKSTLWRQKVEKTFKHSLKQLGQDLTVFWNLLKFFPSINLKPNADSYSMTEDSTLDTPQGRGFGKSSFYQFLLLQLAPLCSGATSE